MQRVFSSLRRIQWPALADVLEVVIIIAWALWITSPYLNFDPQIWPSGPDFPRNIQLFSTWQNLPVCGDCVMWNGSINGGAPAFADVFTPVLNPFFIFATMALGAVNGAKALIILSFILAGLGQLWLGRVLGLSRVARIWTAAMAVAGGQLSARMGGGLVVMVIPIAAASLMLPAALSVARTGSRRSVVLLALTMALTLISGHGYIQIAILVGFLPALLIYWFDSRVKPRPVWRSFLWAAGLTVLLTAVFWLPLIRFWPHIQKLNNLDFSNSQPILYALLNLFISDYTFLTTDILGKPAFPAMYSMFIGWIPLVLAMFGFWLTPRYERRTKLVLFTSIALIYFASSGMLFQLLQNTPIISIFSLVGYPSLLQPLAIPLILALAGWGIDGLRRLSWPSFIIGLGDRVLRISLQWILLVFLLLGLNSVRLFSLQWIQASTVSNSDYPVAELPSNGARWVAMPPGEFSTYPKAIEAHLKIIIDSNFTAWNWVQRTVPAPQVELFRDASVRSDPAYTGDLGPYAVLEHPDRPYAYVQAGSAIVPCPATAIGGHIDVNCNVQQAGLLVVNESYYPGWQAFVNGVSVPVSSDLIQLDVPSGSSTIELRYWPWDVPVGALISLLGLLLCGWVWFRSVPGLPDSVPLEDLDRRTEGTSS
jgi:hypothetical protein